MAEMMDCLVNYFSFNTDEDGMPRRYFSYHIVGGPGPADDSGVASITTLAAYNNNEICKSCQNFHVVKSDGPSAAIYKALRYLDAYHAGDLLRKVQTEIRRSACEQFVPSSQPSDPSAITMREHL